jgi:hypothetical protein
MARHEAAGYPSCPHRGGCKARRLAPYGSVAFGFGGTHEEKTHEENRCRYHVMNLKTTSEVMKGTGISSSNMIK